MHLFSDHPRQEKEKKRIECERRVEFQGNRTGIIVQECRQHRFRCFITVLAGSFDNLCYFICDLFVSELVFKLQECVDVCAEGSCERAQQRNVWIGAVRLPFATAGAEIPSISASFSCVRPISLRSAASRAPIFFSMRTSILARKAGDHFALLRLLCFSV